MPMGVCFDVEDMQLIIFYSCLALMLSTMVTKEGFSVSCVANLGLFKDKLLFSLKLEELAKLSSRACFLLRGFWIGKTDEDFVMCFAINPLSPLTAGFLEEDLPKMTVFLLLFCMKGRAGTFFYERLEPKLCTLLPLWLLAFDKNELKLLCFDL